jgi:hypothetical protein
MVSPRRRAGDRLDRVEGVMDRITGKAQKCIAILSPSVGVLMKCLGRCSRCSELAAQHAAAEPDRERARAEYEQKNPKKSTPPKPKPTFAPGSDDWDA